MTAHYLRHNPARSRAATVFALFGLVSSVLVPLTEASAAPSGGGLFAPGTVVIAEGGTIAGGEQYTGPASGKGANIERNGEVNFYPPNSNGDVAPEASFTKDMYGPTDMAFDPSGDLWVANINVPTLVELTRAQLAMPDPVPAVVISSASHSLDFVSDLAFDSSGNLWVVADYTGRIYEYAKAELAASGKPKPVTTVSDLPSAPLGEAFDAGGNLWVTTVTTTGKPCPSGCVVEFPKAGLAMAHPAPTVVISSTGGVYMAFTPSGDMWMVTGGPGQDGCFGSPCTNELVEFAKADLSASGSPLPVVKIGSTAAGSLWGPYGVAIDPHGDVWVSNFYKPTAVEYGRDQLASPGGSPAPVRTIVGPKTGMNFPSYVATVP
jgi:streptogramin lyase